MAKRTKATPITPLREPLNTATTKEEFVKRVRERIAGPDHPIYNEGVTFTAIRVPQPVEEPQGGDAITGKENQDGEA